MQEIPTALKVLQQAWLPDVTEEIRNIVRSGGRVYRYQDQFRLEQYYSGGGGTFMGRSITKKKYDEIVPIIQSEYIDARVGCRHACAGELEPIPDSLQERQQLEDFLSDREVTLTNGWRFPPDEWRVFPEVFTLAKEVYAMLPRDHFGGLHFNTFRIGSYGGGAAKWSQYEPGVVHMFDCAIEGSRRQFLALLVHETGHAFHQSLGWWGKCTAKKIHAQLRKEEPFALDFLYGPESRWAYAMGCPEEGIPEFYLWYVAGGSMLRAHVEEQNGAWQDMYDFYQEKFNGQEFV